MAVSGQGVMFICKRHIPEMKLIANNSNVLDIILLKLNLGSTPSCPMEPVMYCNNMTRQSQFTRVAAPKFRRN